MKKLFNFIMLMFLLATLTECHAQQLVQTTNDVKKIETNKDEFIDKPLKNILQQIRPEIKRVRVIPGSSESLSTIYLSFLSDSAFHKFYKETGKNPIELRIRLKEHNFKWNPSSRPQNHRFDWTKENKKELGKLTVVDIKVYNEN